MKNKASIREYKSADKNAVLELFRLNTPTYFSPEEEKDLVYYLENEIEYYFVIETENMLVGSGGFNFSGNTAIGKISWDMLHPDFQGRGLGSLLLSYRIDRLKKFEDLTQIIVRTSQLAYRFYEKQGFRLIEVMEDYWAKGFHLYSMELGVVSG